MAKWHQKLTDVCKFGRHCVSAGWLEHPNNSHPDEWTIVDSLWYIIEGSNKERFEIWLEPYDPRFAAGDGEPVDPGHRPNMVDEAISVPKDLRALQGHSGIQVKPENFNRLPFTGRHSKYLYHGTKTSHIQQIIKSETLTPGGQKAHSRAELFLNPCDPADPNPPEWICSDGVRIAKYPFDSDAVVKIDVDIAEEMGVIFKLPTTLS